MQPLSFGLICPEMCRNYFSKQQFPPIPQFETVWRYSFTTVIHERRIRLSQHSWRNGTRLRLRRDPLGGAGLCHGRRKILFSLPLKSFLMRLEVRNSPLNERAFDFKLVFRLKIFG